MKRKLYTASLIINSSGDLFPDGSIFFILLFVTPAKYDRIISPNKIRKFALQFVNSFKQNPIIDGFEGQDAFNVCQNPDRIYGLYDHKTKSISRIYPADITLDMFV